MFFYYFGGDYGTIGVLWVLLRIAAGGNLDLDRGRLRLVVMIILIYIVIVR